MNTIIIDGNNLMHKAGGFSSMKSGRRKALIEAVKSRISRGIKVVFVFDGKGESKSQNIIFSGERTADEVIREFVEKNYEKQKIIVVSSDNFITSLAKKCRCEIKTSQEFWNEINPSTEGKNINQNYIYNELEKPERMSRKEIDEFKKYFT